jgi:hypothetical protein
MQNMGRARIHKMLCAYAPRGNCLLVDAEINEKTSLAPEIKTGFQVPSVSEKEDRSAKKSSEEIQGNKN